MSLCINGQWQEINTPVSIAILLENLGYRDHFLAVAVNDYCVPRSRFADFELRDKDCIEILAPMAGG